MHSQIVQYAVVYAAVALSVAAATTALRGLPQSKLTFYDPAKDFRCLDGSQTIPFSHINDDYCDCHDGTDEPGTSACPNGSFYCRNPGYKPITIPSSRVNDRICDCCDGEDEYDSGIQCPNYCSELGQQLREEEERQRKLKLEGYEIYLQYVREGKEAVMNKRTRLQELQQERDAVDMERAKLEQHKNEVEQPEKEAKERHEKWWEEEKAKRKEEKKLSSAKEAFANLDANHDERISLTEMMQHMEFDIDSNGEVSLEEAKEYLEENEEVTFDIFSDKIWENIHEIYRRPGEVPPKKADDSPLPPAEEVSDTQDREESDDDRDDHYDDTDHEDDDDEGHSDDHERHDEKITSSNTVDEEEKMPDYDENTKYLIEAADKVRQEYNVVDTKFRDVENEINDLKKVIEQDLGSNSEFYSLMGKCFDFTDREYTYSLCPFDKTSQRSKNGGMETSLGRWGVWAGSADNNYSIMKYEHGQNCWNGPDRSAKVHIQCGVTNELVSVAEPNRCEYRFVFNTPAACSQGPESFDPHASHTEL